MAVRKRKGRRRPWVFDYYDLMPDGTRKRRAEFFRTKGEADAAEEMSLKRKPAGRPSQDPFSTVKACSERFLKVAAATTGWNTYLHYESNLRTHILPPFGRWKMRDFDRGPFMAFLAEKLQEPVTRGRLVLRPKRSPDTVRGILATGSALASFAVNEGIYTANPFLRLGKALGLSKSRKARQDRTKKKAMTRDQLTRFLAKVEEIAPWYWTLFLLLARTGLRINEALALRVPDVDLEAGTLNVERAKVRGSDEKWVLGRPKSDQGIRTVRLSPQLTSALRRWLEVERAKDKLRHGWQIVPPWLFYADRDPSTYDAISAAGTLDDSNVRRIMRRVLRALHNEDEFASKRTEERFPLHFTPHAFRHTFASLLLSEGKDLQSVRQQLGHESIKLTADTYGAWLPSTAASSNDCLDDPNWRETSHHARADGD